jgi:hypothetical protein
MPADLRSAAHDPDPGGVAGRVISRASAFTATTSAAATWKRRTPATPPRTYIPAASPRPAGTITSTTPISPPGAVTVKPVHIPATSGHRSCPFTIARPRLLESRGRPTGTITR